LTDNHSPSASGALLQAAASALLLVGLCAATCVAADRGGDARGFSERVVHVELHGRRQKLRLFEPVGPATGLPVLFMSGDAPWFWLPPRLARRLASSGHLVVGLSGHDYLVAHAPHSRPLDRAAVQQDFALLAGYASSLDPLGRKPVLLGWSLGAGYCLLAAASPEVARMCALVVAVSLADRNELAWRRLDAITWITGGDAWEPSFRVSDLAPSVREIPVVVIQGDRDRFAPVRKTRMLFELLGARKRMIELPREGHLFCGSRSRELLVESIEDGLGWAASGSNATP
jgi:pimeloyl-ACP methyl ester carboxylesterase